MKSAEPTCSLSILAFQNAQHLHTTLDIVAMKLRFCDGDSDDDGNVRAVLDARTASTAHLQRAVHCDSSSHTPSPRCNRFRAPSLSESATESSDDDDDSDDNDSETLALGSALSSLHVALLNSKSRQGTYTSNSLLAELQRLLAHAHTHYLICLYQPIRCHCAMVRSISHIHNTHAELLHHVERTCEIKAVHAVNSSRAYQLLCETLQRARADAEAKLKRVDATQHDDAAFQALLRKVDACTCPLGSIAADQTPAGSATARRSVVEHRARVAISSSTQSGQCLRAVSIWAPTCRHRDATRLVKRRTDACATVSRLCSAADATGPCSRPSSKS